MSIRIRIVELDRFDGPGPIDLRKKLSRALYLRLVCALDEGGHLFSGDLAVIRKGIDQIGHYCSKRNNFCEESPFKRCAVLMICYRQQRIPAPLAQGLPMRVCKRLEESVVGFSDTQANALTAQLGTVVHR
jgi:hypothetical protein